MKSFSISITSDNTKQYPLHQHDNWEIMYYLEGKGQLATKIGGVPFSPGTIIIVPPKTLHGSVSESFFKNISIGGDFGHLFMFDSILSQQDNQERDGEKLARLVIDNRNASSNYLSSLINSYTHFLLENLSFEKRINRTINNIVIAAQNSFFDQNFNITELLRQSGYAEDYIRAKFKEQTLLSPIDFLTKLRIDHACWLFQIYGQGISVSRVSEVCGFDDCVYFSKRFKQFANCSPKEYQKQFT